ncbi:cysteine hydrolase [Chitiniphilus shinanonensis]|uniref:Cysteine hydrolase n=1 Tax=Chitiniphilus shinanonensis TaxID=553088 RepID=A0ABQ6BQA2_9NEIS|nr:cysteine hydrolase family protein [Chitiniphilus shinanonensis]GLS04210.1 cysteine hydrolase [Chitiniphilus shinanonensis]
MQRALIVIDVQNEYETGGLKIEYPPFAQTLARVGEAMDAAHAAGIPVVVIQHSEPADAPVFAVGSHGWQLHEAVARRPRDHHVEKHQASVLAGTGLADWLRQHGIDTLTIVGYMTQNCDDSTVKQAAHEGFAVEFLSDASGALALANRAGHASAEEVHRVTMVVMQSNFAAVLTTGEWIAAVNSGVAPERDNILVSYRRAHGLA